MAELTRRQLLGAASRALFGTAAAAALAGCGGGGGGGGAGTTSGGGIELDFWHTQSGANEEPLEELVRRFNDQHGPDLAVKLTFQGDYTDNNRKVMAAIQAKALPDLTVAYPSMIADYMKANVLSPAEQWVEGPEGLSKESLDDIFPAFLDDNRHPLYDNRLLSFPFTKSVLCMYVNEDALAKVGKPVPRTWAEFADAARALTNPKANPPMKGLVMEVNPSTLHGWIYSNGGKLLTDDNRRVRFDEPPAVEVFDIIGGLFRDGAAYQVPRDEYQQDFGAQRAGMFCGSSTRRSIVREAVAGKFKWSIVNIPQRDPANPVTVLYGANICMFRSTPEREKAAWTFIKWLTDKEQAAYWATESSYMPLRKSVAQTEVMKAAWAKDPQGKQAFDLLPYGIPEPAVAGWQEIRDVVKEAMVRVITGRATASESLKEAAAQANAILEENR